jgi:Flp pilus assembly protein TadD
VLALALGGCVKAPAPTAPQRLAVLRFENLSPDGSLGWVGRALSEVVTAQLAAVPGVQAIPSVRLHSFDRLLGPRPISAPGISTETTQAILAGASRFLYGDYTIRNGKLEVRATLEEARGSRMVKTFTVTSPAGDVLGAATAIARNIDSKAAAFGTRSGTALSEYIGALESGNAGRMERGLTAAIQADPDFPAPYRLLAQERAQRGDRAGAGATLEQALARGDRIPPVDRVRFELESAEIAGDIASRHLALLKLVKLDPTDPVPWRALGESALARHDYTRSMESFQKATGLEASDAAAWNSLGYAAAYAGDLTAGTNALRRYQALTPAGANPLDSLGDIHLISGKLAEAEQFYQQSFQKDPNFNNQGSLLKVAIARLYAGDVAAADQAAGKYFDVRAQAKDPILDYRRAQWLWLTGRRKQAFQQMQSFADGAENTPLRDSASRADAELSMWKLMTGDRPGALQLAEKAFRMASPAARGNAIVAAFLSLPPASASEWTVRAEQQFGGPGQTSIRNFALTYALLVNKEYQPAGLLLKQMWESGTPIADEGMPVMLAWTLIQTGKPQDAGPLLKFNPVPNANGLTPYASFYLPRIFYLRGKLAEKEGRDALAEFKKFLALSGDLPLVWGEEKDARK